MLEQQTNQPVFDVRYSGSTCISVLTFGTKLYIANVGDSRAILISEKISDLQDNNNNKPKQQQQ